MSTPRTGTAANGNGHRDGEPHDRDDEPTRPGTGLAARSTDGPTASGPRLHPLVRVLIGFVAFLAVQLTLFYVVEPLVRPLYESDSIEFAITVSVVFQLLPAVFVVLLVWLLMRFIDRRPLRESGWRWSKWSIVMLLIGIVSAALLVVVGQLVAQTAGLVPAPVIEEAPDASGDAGGGIASFSWYVIVLSLLQSFIVKPFLMQALPEELMFRGYLLQTWRDRPGLIIALTTVLFGSMHIMSAGGQENLAERFIYLLPAAAFGFFAAVLVVWTRSLWAAVGVHGGFHLGTIVADAMGDTANPGVWTTNAALFFVAGGVLLWIAASRGMLRRGIVIDR